MSSNHKAIVAIGVLVMGLGALIAIGALQEKTAGGRESMLMMGGLFVVLGTTPILLVIASGRRRKGGRHGQVAKVLLGAPAELPGRVRVEFSTTTPLPSICACCGQATKELTDYRMVNISNAYQKYDSSRLGPAAFFLFWKQRMMIALGVVLITRIQHLLRRKSAARGDVLFRIPHCRPCAQQHPIRVHHADFHSRRMIILAHPGFASRVFGGSDRG